MGFVNNRDMKFLSIGFHYTVCFFCEFNKKEDRISGGLPFMKLCYRQGLNNHAVQFMHHECQRDAKGGHNGYMNEMNFEHNNSPLIE